MPLRALLVLAFGALSIPALAQNVSGQTTPAPFVGGRTTWEPAKSALESDVINFLRSLNLLDESKMVGSVDLQGGFAILPDDLPPIQTEADLRAYVKRVQGHIAGWDMHSAVVRAWELGNGYINVVSTSRGVAYYHRGLPNYTEVRNAWILRRTPDGLKLVQQLEGAMGPIPYVRRLHQLMADEWTRERLGQIEK
jgi:hypothetical protein